MDSVDLINDLNKYNDLSPDVFSVLFNLASAAFCAFLVGKFYERFGTSLSNRNYLAKNFLILCITTTLIITVIKSSITLSLGLVGALSIVRFRTAIKEPEELAFLFLVIAIGIGFGAEMGVLTAISTIIILTAFYVEKKQAKDKSESGNNLFLNIQIKEFQTSDFEFLRSVLVHKEISLKRFDEKDKNARIVLALPPISLEDLTELREKLTKDSRYSLNFVEQLSVY